MTCSVENMAVDKASEHFVVIKYFRCLLSCHGFNICFSLPFPCFPFQSPLPYPCNTHTHTQQVCMRSEVAYLKSDEALDYCLHPAPAISSVPIPDWHSILPPLAPIPELFQWLIITAGQHSELWLSLFPSQL